MPYYRRNLLVLWAAVFLASISWYQVVPFLPLFLQQMGIKHSHILHWSGWVYAAQSVACIVTMPYWGKLGDRYGRKPMCVRAGICLAGVYFGMSLCRIPIHLVIMRFLDGALTGFVPCSMALVATNTPEDRGPRYVASLQIATASGAIIGPFVGAELAKLVGYRSSMLVAGSAVLVCTLLVTLLVREPNKPKLAQPTSLLQDFSTALRSPVLYTVLFVVFLTGFFSASLDPILPIHLSNLNGSRIDPRITGRVFTLLAIALVTSAYGWTRFGGKHGYHTSIRIGLIGTAACCLFLAFAHSVLSFACVLFITGLFLSSIAPSATALIVTRVNESFRSRAYGIHLSAGTVGSLVAPIIASYTGAAFGIPSVFILICCMFTLGALAFPTMVRHWETT
jgi:MFS family permease